MLNRNVYFSYFLLLSINTQNINLGLGQVLKII